MSTVTSKELDWSDPDDVRLADLFYSKSRSHVQALMQLVRESRALEEPAVDVSSVPKTLLQAQLRLLPGTEHAGQVDLARDARAIAPPSSRPAREHLLPHRVLCGQSPQFARCHRRRRRRRKRGVIGAGVVGGGAGGELSEEVSLAAAHLDRFAADGVPTLVFAQRLVSLDEFVFRHARYTARRNTVDASRNVAVAAVAAEMEAARDLLAVMDVEDKLGSLMPETVAFLHAAGIRLWVLMGVMRETAENIGYSAPLLAPSVRVVHVASPPHVPPSPPSPRLEGKGRGEAGAEARRVPKPALPTPGTGFVDKDGWCDGSEGIRRCHAQVSPRREGSTLV